MPATSVTEVQAHLATLKQLYPDARHHCYAYRWADQQFASDAGEPAHSAGAPILRALLQAELTEVCCSVVRYFGGVKLGVPGLIAAYGGAARAAILAAELVPYYPTQQITLQVPYELEGVFKSHINKLRWKTKGYDYSAHITFTGYIHLQDVTELEDLLINIGLKFK